VSGDDSLITIGVIGRPQGIKGEVRITSQTDWPDRFLELSNVFLDPPNGDGYQVEVKKARFQGKQIILKLAGIEDRNSAESLRGSHLKVTEESCSELPDGFYHIHDLIGMAIKTTSGTTLGFLTDVLKMPAHDVYVVDCNGKEVMIPAVKEFVKKINLSGREMIIEPIEGLLGDDES